MSDREIWDRKYRDEERPQDPSRFLTSLADRLPVAGRALDVAGGNGRNAVWLAKHGLNVTAADVSPVALNQARDRARDAGVPLECVEVDFTVDPFPPGPWDLVCCLHYLQRSLFPAMIQELAPNGLLVFTQPTICNLERHDRPPREFLLDEGEAPSLVSGLTILDYDEGWTDEGRHEVRLVAQKKSAQA